MEIARHGQDKSDPSEITVKIEIHVSPASNEVVVLRGQRGYRRKPVFHLTCRDFVAPSGISVKFALREP
jgi:hypothetical protein